MEGNWARAESERPSRPARTRKHSLAALKREMGPADPTSSLRFGALGLANWACDGSVRVYLYTGKKSACQALPERTLWYVPQMQDDFFFLLLGDSLRVVSGKGVGFVCLLSLVVPTQECPSGIVNEENFKQIYSQFFPQGGKE